MINKHIRNYSYNSLILFLILAAALCFAVSCALPESGQEQRQSYDPNLGGWRTASWSPFTVEDTVNAFAFGNDRYVAVSGTGVIGWSADGDIWHRANINPDFKAGLNGVAYGDGMFVAVGNGGIFAWSENGEDWTGSEAVMSGFGTEDICGITWGAGYFVVVGDNSNISVSANGINWKGCRDQNFNGVRLNDIAFDSENGNFYVVGNGGRRGWTDAGSLANWFRAGNPATDNYGWNPRGGPQDPPFYNSDDLTSVAAGRYRDGPGIGVVSGSRIAIATLADFSGFDADLEAFLLNNNQMNRIAWGGGYFVVAGTSAMIGHWHSADPSNNGARVWMAYSFSDFKKWEISALEACNGRFFIGNVGGKIGYSK